MPCENPNKQIIEDFIATAIRLLEGDGQTVESLIRNLDPGQEYCITDSEGIKYTYVGVNDAPTEEYSDSIDVKVKSDLMQEYHSLTQTH